MRPCVIVIEDRPQHAFLFCELLRHGGFDAVVATTGREGLASVQARGPALVIVDILLGDIDGRTVISDLRGAAATRDIPILAISALGDRNMSETCLAAGADLFLSKPVGLASFQAAVQELIAA